MDNILDSRYKGLLVSLLLFLMIVAGVLCFNYYANRQVTQVSNFFDTFGHLSDEYYNINLQTQRLQITTDEERQATIATLRKTINQVDEFMKLHESGGNYQDERGTMHIEPLKGEDDLRHFDTLKTWWAEYKRRILPVLNGNPEIASVAKHTYSTYESQAYTPISEIWHNHAVKAERWSSLSATVMILGFLIAGVYCAWFVFYFLKKLTRSDDELHHARRQTANILDTVNEGLFLIDKDSIISDIYSKNLETIFARRDIAGNTLIGLLQNTIRPEELEATELFIEQLYNDWVIPELIMELNPLKQIKIGVIDNTGNGTFKYLSFNFLKVEDEDSDEVFVSVVDVTNSVMLEHTLVSEKAQHNRQIEMIGCILNVDSVALNTFITNTRQRVEEMNSVLKTDGQMHNKAQTLLRKIHSLKGEASAISMDSFVALAEQGEEHLETIRNKEIISGNDFLGLTVVLDKILDLTQFVENLIVRLREVTQSQLHQAPATDTRAVMDWQAYFETYALQVAKRQGKEVSLNLIGFDDIELNEKTTKFCQDVGIQLVKNAIVHGIETPSERSNIGKGATGKITLMLSPVNDKLRLSVIDDGAGVNLDELCQKAIQMGILTAEQAKKTPKNKLYALMFRSGVTTAKETDQDAGRGVGMDIVKNWIQDMNGKVNIESMQGLHTKIVIDFDGK